MNYKLTNAGKVRAVGDTMQFSLDYFGLENEPANWVQYKIEIIT